MNQLQRPPTMVDVRSVQLQLCLIAKEAIYLIANFLDSPDSAYNAALVLKFPRKD
jgi:hypothetical protein